MRMEAIIPFALLVGRAKAHVACVETASCIEAFQDGSDCVDGFCTNPFTKGGCLARKLPNWENLRVCTSEDPSEATSRGWCRPPPMNYQEVRLMSLNWESAIFSTWITQILLTELVGVPSSVESGDASSNLDFYNLHNRMEYVLNRPEQEALKNAWQADGDCMFPVSKGEPCTHFIPEIWSESEEIYTSLVADGIIDEPTSAGVLAEQQWFIPKFTAEMYPFLGHYHGLRNRTILADIFLTPTTWSQYCQEVSTDNCSTVDEVATRPPTQSEADAMYMHGEYMGHFRKLPEQDCDRFPDTCYGHIADYPCAWGSHTRQNAYHLGIPLRSTGPDSNGGYSYTQLTQIWAAANHTKSPLIQLWWKPESLYDSFRGTDAEFTPVILPPPTQECLENRVHSLSVCEEADDVAAGNPLGACDSPPQALRKGVSTALRTIAKNPDLDSELWSPAYDLILNYRITELQHSQIFRRWLGRGVDLYGYDPREAVCQWVVDNIDSLTRFVPKTYPRTVQIQNRQNDSLFVVTSIIALLGALLVLVAAILTHSRRMTKTIYYTNEHFMYLTLSGLLCITLSAWLLTIDAQETSCVLSVWFENIGFILAIVPTVVRVDAISSLSHSGKQMQRIRVGTRRLLLYSGIACIAVVAYVMAWVVSDTPIRLMRYRLKGEMEDGVSMVTAVDYCGSKYTFWYETSVAWRAALVAFAGATAFMASRVQADLNDTRALFSLTMVHVFFAVLRLIALVIRDSVDPVVLMGYCGIMLGTEVVVALIVFVYPKLFRKMEKHNRDEPLPDLFLKTTIMYAHIVGLTAWSSVREPAQVFKFLETIYSTFDVFGEKRKVFKVETMGGTYVAATGIPRERNDHAVAMAYFASDIQSRFKRLVKELEVLYGPDTGELTLRIGLHSGAVTGGFLKGKGARFQLFGDTINTAQHMEDSCEKGRIQVSEKTADALKNAGKGGWLVRRFDKVCIKGRGDIQTYWMYCLPDRKQVLRRDADKLNGTGDDDLHDLPDESSLNDRKRRLVDWIVEVLQNLLKQIEARKRVSLFRSNVFDSDETLFGIPGNTTPLEEVQEIIRLPEFDPKTVKQQKDVADITLQSQVVKELRCFVTKVAASYRDNPFHNFVHASHVVMATLKSINRMMAPTSLEMDDNEMHFHHKAAATLHDRTYGITSDPLTQFACVFSALILDLDHPGVPNSQLRKEHPRMAANFKHRSIAEQNAFQLAWGMIMQDEFKQLRHAICGNAAGLFRFRQLVINSVMASDLVDQQLQMTRNDRWSKAFRESALDIKDAVRDDVNRKATVVIEHLIQASALSYAMQHWEVYREWNENLFREMYHAYREGRADKNPAEYWYEGEIAFFEFCILPLLQKLNGCGVFGITSDENWTYANRNRELWMSLGQEATAEMLKKCQAEWDDGAEDTASSN